MKKSIKRPLIYIYFILLCCVFLSTALSRNATKVNGSASMELAGMKLNVVTETTNLSKLSNAQQDISFTVNNYDGTKDAPILNDTEYEYQISITTDKKVPIEYELYKIENGTETKVTMSNGTSENFTMPHSKIQEDKFILKVKLDNKEYKKIEDVLNIDVYAVQS